MFRQILCWGGSDFQVEALPTQNLLSWVGNRHPGECCWILYLYEWCTHGIARADRRALEPCRGLYQIVASIWGILVFHLLPGKDSAEISDFKKIVTILKWHHSLFTLPNKNLSRLLFAMYSYTRSSSGPLLQQPSRRIRFRWWTLLISVTSLAKSALTLLDWPRASFFTATTFPFFKVPCEIDKGFINNRTVRQRVELIWAFSVKEKSFHARCDGYM